MFQTILVISADRYRAKVIEDSLVRAGYFVRCAYSGQVALEMISQEMPILVLLDWMLPDMSGLTLTRWLRAEGRTRRLPVVLTGEALSDEDRLRGFEAGADDCFGDTFNAKVFVARIHALLRRLDPMHV